MTYTKLDRGSRLGPTALRHISPTLTCDSDVVGAPMQILLIEDDEDLRCEIGEALSRRQHSIEAVGSAAAARQSLNEKLSSGDTLDAVVCDINLPDGDGITLYTEFAARRPACPWILMSGDADPRRIEEARLANPALPTCRIVDKPVSIRSLMGILAGPKHEM